MSKTIINRNYFKYFIKVFLLLIMQTNTNRRLLYKNFILDTLTFPSKPRFSYINFCFFTSKILCLVIKVRKGSSEEPHIVFECVLYLNVHCVRTCIVFTCTPVCTVFELAWYSHVMYCIRMCIEHVLYSNMYCIQMCMFYIC